MKWHFRPKTRWRLKRNADRRDDRGTKPDLPPRTTVSSQICRLLLEMIAFERKRMNVVLRLQTAWKYNESSREKLPKSIAVPPTARTVSDMRSNRVSIKCLCWYKWRHRGDFLISSYSPRYRLQRGKKGAFFNTFHNNKFWPFKELYIKNWAESSKSL